MKNQTSAVEWFSKELKNRFKRNNSHLTCSEWASDMIDKLSEQAKQMEAEQQQKMVDDALTNYELGLSDRKKQFSLYQHKETITSADTKVSETFLDHVPDVRKMVEISECVVCNKETQLHTMCVDCILNMGRENQTEISDEEIEKFFNEELKSDEARIFAKGGAKWYREQLKKKQ